MRPNEIHAERDRKLETARQQRQSRCPACGLRSKGVHLRKTNWWQPIRCRLA
jgi:hypothetical protein